MPLREILVVDAAIQRVNICVISVFVGFPSVHLGDNQVVSGHKNSGIGVVLTPVVDISDHAVLSSRHIYVYRPFVVFHILEVQGRKSLEIIQSKEVGVWVFNDLAVVQDDKCFICLFRRWNNEDIRVFIE
jgi:hypothetical protein